MIKYDDFISNFYNIQLVFLGISITVFTVIFAFIVTKRDELKSLNNRLSQKEISPNLVQKRVFLIATIEKLNLINRYSILIIITSFLLFVISFYLLFFCFSNLVKDIIFYSLNLILLIEIILVFYLLFKALAYFKKMSRI